MVTAIKKFRYHHSLKEHMVRAHSADGQPCSSCESVFPNKSELKRHTAVCGSNDAPFKCFICASNFGFKSNLARHMKTKHFG